MRTHKPVTASQSLIAGKSCLLLLLIFSASLAGAHPMGNFSINHYTRFEVKPDGILLRYILDLAEIPTVTEKGVMDSNRDGQITPEERTAYVQMRAAEYGGHLVLTLNGRPRTIALHPESLELRPGAGGLETLRLTFSAVLPPDGKPDPQPVALVYRDDNFSQRTGWKEIVARTASGAALPGSSVPAQDLSQELTVYPRDPAITPPQQAEARFTVVGGPWSAAGKENQATGAAQHSGSSPLALPPLPGSQSAGQPGTPHDAFTQAIATRALTPGALMLGLLLAFLFGAAHALSPGHGKAMVAAYLVGARGTARHALLLGITVTVTHVLGVYLLGLVTLVASQYILPERLYTILSVVSGVAVCGVGLSLLVSRLRGMPTGHPHQDHGHDHIHDHAHHEHHQDDAHSHDHSHEHDPVHLHGHGQGHSHGLGRHHHHHLPDGPITVKSLVALGISGGIVPCPSALVVLLSAIALHRLIYGLMLITAFSAGLAAVLVALGITVVSARQWVTRVPASGALLKRLPVASAAVIVVVGAILIFRALSGTP